jgi:gliding motility-associated-like protein
LLDLKVVKKLFRLLLLSFCFLAVSTDSFGQTLIMNEVSNGPSGNQEYVEFAVIDTTVSYDCNVSTPPCIDIRGWIFDDNSGYHGSSGIAGGAVRFSSNSLWSCVPLGTIIVIYNDADPNPQMPPADLSLNDGNCRIIAPISSTTLFERNSTTPGAIACSYPATGWTAGGTWSNTLLANTGDCARIVDLNGCEVFSVCWAAANQNTLIYFSSGGSGSQNVWYFNYGAPNDQSNWSEGSAAVGGNQTPGVANNTLNQAYIGQFNNGCTPISELTVTAASSNAACACDGSATATATGSIPGYSYSWYDSNFVPIGQTSPTANGLCAGTYHVVVTSSIGCADTASVDITSNSSISATVNSSTICEGSSAALIATPGASGSYSYSWTVPTGVTNPGNAASFTSGTAGTYSVVITNTVTGCSSSPASGTLTVNPNPTPTVNNPVVCQGNSALVTADLGTAGSFSYSWTVPTGVSNPGNVPSFTTGTAGTYSVVVSNTVTGCSSLPASGSVTLNPSPVATVNSAAVCAGSTATLTADPGAAGNFSYSWTVPTGVTNPGNVPSFTAGTAGTYSVVVTNTVTGCSNSPASGTVTLNPNPVATVNSAAVCTGNTEMLTADPGAAGSFSYSWTVPTGVTNPGDLPSFTTGTAGTYSVVITNTVTGCSSSPASGTVTLNPNPVATVNSAAVCAGNTATLTADPGATGNFSYSWTVPTGVTNPGNVSSFTSGTAGTYSVVITNTVTGCTSSPASGTVTLNPNPVATVNSATVCTGNTATLTADSGAAGNFSYSWTVPTGVTNPGNVPSLTTGTAGTYSVVVTNTVTGCSSLPASGIVAVNPIPSLTVNNPSACEGNSGTFTATPSETGNYIYSWTTPQGATQPGDVVTFTTSVEGIYSVFITNTNTSCISAEVSGVFTVNALPEASISGTTLVCQNDTPPLIMFTGMNGIEPYIFTYNLNNGPNVSVNSTGNTATIPVPTSTSGTFTFNLVSVQDGSLSACSQNQAGVVTITVNPLPTATLTGTTEVCEGGPSPSVTFSGMGGQSPYTFSYSLNEGTPQTITSIGNSVSLPLPASTAGVFSISLIGVEEGSQTTCYQNQSATAVITVHPAPDVSAGPDLTVCEGQSVTLIGQGALNYTWDNGVSNGISFVPSLGLSTYTVTGTTAEGCTGEDQVEISVLSSFQASFSADVTTGCAPLTVAFTNTSGVSNYCVWSFSNGQQIEDCGTVNMTFNDPGCYDVELTVGLDGCSTTFSASSFVCVDNYPEADFQPSTFSISEMDNVVQFTNESIGASSFEWNFGDGSSSTSTVNAVHEFDATDASNFEVTLIAYSDFGCSDTSVVVIESGEDLIYYVPNAFTPDGDIYNQTFKPVFTSGFDPYNYQLLIFNRWGEIVFESNNFEIGWDGSYGSGEYIFNCKSDIYTWKITFKTRDGDERKQLTGHVSLLR